MIIEWFCLTEFLFVDIIQTMKEKKIIFIFDFDGTFYSGDEMFSKLPAYIARHRRDFLPNLSDEEYKKVVTEKTTIEKERNVPSVDGRQHWYRVYKAPILDVNNEGNGLVTIVKNIDREKTLEAQKELFLATLTHDLKNPVQAQLMSLNMLNNGTFGELNPEQKEMLELVIESAYYMRDMLNTILDTY